MDWKDAFELASYVVTVIGLPCAIGIFFYEQRKERENEEEEQYQHLSDAYNEFLKIVLDHAGLQLRTHEPLPSPTPEQRELWRKALQAAWPKMVQEVGGDAPGFYKQMESARASCEKKS